MPAPKKKFTKTRTFSTHEAKTNLSKIIRLVEESDCVVHICRNATPVVEVRKIKPVASDPLRIHPQLSKITFAESPLAPADESEWPEEYR